MALNSHTSGGYWHSIFTPRGATGTGARDTGATGMLPLISPLNERYRCALFVSLLNMLDGMPCYHDDQVELLLGLKRQSVGE